MKNYEKERFRINDWVWTAKQGTGKVIEVNEHEYIVRFVQEVQSFKKEDKSLSFLFY